jgi:hypothetical protein
MPTDIIVATDQPTLSLSSARAISSGGAYDTTAPTASAPSTTSTTALLVGSISGNKPSLMHVIPVAINASTAPSSSNMTGSCVRIVGWQEYVQAAGTTVYIPKILAEVQMTFPATAQTLAVDGTNTYWFQTAAALSLAPAPAIYTPGTAAGTNTQPAGFVVDTIGCRWVTAQFKATTAPASTSMAVFYAVL